MTTHQDIYTKFMIEYDKANVTSSYPALTQFEVATLLDKAYDITVDRKFTGMNNRKAFFEADIKTIEDLQPLVKHRLIYLGNDGDIYKANNNFPKDVSDSTIPMHQFEREVADATKRVAIKNLRSMPDNLRSFNMPKDMLYFIAAGVPQDIHNNTGWLNDDRATIEKDGQFVPMDSKISDREDEAGKVKWIRYVPAQLVTHKIAEKFYATAYNIPWVKNPMCYIENNKVFLVVDPIVGIPSLSYTNEDTSTVDTGEWVSLTYIRQHNKFLKDLNKINNTLVYKKELESDVLYKNASLSFKIDRFNCRRYDSSHPDYPNKYYTTSDNNIHVNSIEVSLGEIVPNTYDWTFYFEAESDFDETSMSVENLLSCFRIEGGQVIIDPYILDGKTYTVKWSNTDDSCNIVNGQKIVACGYRVILSGEPENPEISISLTSNIFSISYESAKILLNKRGLLLGKPIYIAERHASENPDHFSLLVPGSYSVLQYANRLFANFDSVAFPDYIKKSVGSDQHGENIYCKDWFDFSMFSFKVKDAIEIPKEGANSVLVDGKTINELYTFELSDSMANEIVTTAITFALENVESTRLQSHSSLMTLEP